MKNKHSLRMLLSALAIAAFALPGSGRVDAAEEPLPDQLSLRLGGYNIRNSNSIVRRDSNGFPAGAYIDFNDTLGGESTATVFRADGLYRFNNNHALGFSWYSINFSGSRVADTTINWGDQVYPVNFQIDSKLEFDVYKLNYQYSLLRDEKAELGALIGFHVLKTAISLNGFNAGAQVQSSSESVTAPLPVFGLFARYNFTRELAAYYNYQWFFVNYEDTVKGGLQDFILGLEYRLVENVSLGVAYNRFALHLEAKNNSSTTFVDTNWNGGMLYAGLHF
jgi:hypothetical protein